MSPIGVDSIVRDLPVTWYPAANFTSATRRGGDLDLVVEHMAITPELATSAEGVARYFQNRAVRASAHFTADNDSITQSVLLKNVAWAAPGANHDGVQIEHAGLQTQTAAQFRDRYSLAMFKLSARLQARIAVEADLPVVWRSPSEVRAGLRGFTSHDNVSKAFGRSDHWDGRAPFPYYMLLGLIRDEVKLLGKRDPEATDQPFRKQPPTLKVGGRAPVWRVKQAQKFLNLARSHHGNAALKVDGKYGRRTANAVRAFQRAHGLDGDRIVGPFTWRLLFMHKDGHPA